MSNIINKSNHPVEVKRIDVRVWKIRDEIEAAIAKKIADNDGNAQVDIEDIKEYYTRSKPKWLSADYDPEDDNDQAIGADGTDSSGNEMDDDAKAMMEALQEGEQAEDKESEDKDSEGEKSEDKEADDKDSEGEKSEDKEADDDEAAKLAAEMLGDQGKAEEPTQAALTRIYPDGDKISSGFALLSDLNMERILFFSNRSYTHGQNVALEFLIPSKFIISGEIYSCINMERRSNIISETKPNFRIEMDITYLWDGERTNLRDFLKQVEPEIPPPPKKVKRSENQGGDEDEFEDLGF